jgi:hypothetical protein
VSWRARRERRRRGPSARRPRPSGPRPRPRRRVAARAARRAASTRSPLPGRPPGPPAGSGRPPRRSARRRPSRGPTRSHAPPARASLSARAAQGAGPHARLLRADPGAAPPPSRDCRRRAHAGGAVLALLTKGEDYAYAQPSLTRKKLRRLELLGGGAQGRGQPRALGREQGDAPSGARTRRTGRARLRAQRPRLAVDAEEGRCGCDTGARIFKSPNGTSSAAGHSPRPCALARRHPHRRNCLKAGRPRQARVDFHPSREAGVPACMESGAPRMGSACRARGSLGHMPGAS